MSFCKKGLHSFLSFTCFDDTTSPSHSPCPPPPPPLLHKCQPAPLAIGLASATRDSLRPPNVLESATVGPLPLPVTPPSPSGSLFADGYGLRKATGGFLMLGFFEEVGEVVDGLMSCTETLGFESSDERRVNEVVRDLGKDGGARGGGGGGDDLDVRSRVLSRAKRREGSGEKVRDRKFPPPIKSLNSRGQPSFFLRALRRDRRLELEEVRIDRPEILHASRVDGRLRLEFVEEKEAGELKEEAEDAGETIEVTGEEYKQVEEDEEEEEWTLGVSSGEGFRRCHEMVGERHRHYNDLHVWRQHCVTIR